MKDFIIPIIATLPLVLLYILMNIIYNGFGQRILTKDRLWIRYLVLWVGLLLFKTGLCTWAPGKLGLQIEYFDGLISLRDGDLAGNLAILLFIHSGCLAITLLGHLWKAIRKKGRFSGKFVLLELVTIVVFIFLGIQAVNKAKEMPRVEPSRMVLMMALGVILALWGYSGVKKGQKETAKKPAAPQRGTPAVPTAEPVADADARFEQVIAEKDRLTAMGDYASQIPLLTAATGLAVDDGKKARIWNYLGLAYERMNSARRAEECYRSVLLFDKDNPAAHNNLALLYSGRGDHPSALRHMDAAIPAAKARKQALGVYYGNYALITGRAGNLSRAEDYLTLAKNAGYDDASIQAVRRQLGMK